MKTTLPKTIDYLPSMFAQAAARLAASAAREKLYAVSCWSCRSRFHVVDAPDDNVMVRCEKCGKEFRLGDGMTLLDWAEFKLALTVVGFWVFLFQRIPAWVFSRAVAFLVNIQAFALWLVPTAWKLLRVAGWGVLAVSIPVVPAAVLGVIAVRVDKLLRPPLLYCSPVMWALAIGWSLLVLGGYSWAFANYRRKKKQRRPQISVVLPMSPDA